MTRRAFRGLAVLAAAALTGSALLLAPAAAAAKHGPAVLHVGQIARQDVAPRPGSEPDTLVEPDVASDPRHPNVAGAVAHDGRYPDGGAVGILSAWTADGGIHWRHAPVPGITTATRGPWPRASDPVLAFGPDGSVYLSVLLFQPYGCPTAVAVLRSTTGGRAWGPPVYADRRTSCGFSDDKNWIVVDTSPASPHYGRIYQFWTPFRFSAAGRYLGSPQAVRWSDDRARHWSGLRYVTNRTDSSQDSQPMIRPDGTIVDAYQYYRDGDVELPDRPGSSGQSSAARPRAAGADTGVDLLARTSRDGGATWSRPSLVGASIGEGPAGIRCCLASATADPVTGQLFAAWIGAASGMPVMLARSTNGRTWSSPVAVSRDSRAATMTHVNVDVSAYAHRVFLSYGTRNEAVAGGRYVQQLLSASYDDAVSFRAPLALGPSSDLRYSAFARGHFPGDYIGSAATASKLYLVWPRSYAPRPPATYHQTLYAAVLAP